MTNGGKRLTLWSVSLAAVGFSVYWFGGARTERGVEESGATPTHSANAAHDGGSVRWIVAGGGSFPESNQLSIEENLGFAAETFGPGGWLLFAGGRGSHGVQILGVTDDRDPVVRQLSRIFNPRPGRQAHYRRTELAVDGPATLDRVGVAIREAAGQAAGDLLIYLAGHGERGETPDDNAVLMWGGGALTVHDLAEILDGTRGRRTVRVVVTSCFSGGFAELAFVDADSERGRPAAGRCGLFATTADELSSGCDADPDRATRHGYGVHFLNALRGRDVRGRPIDLAYLDLNRDGAISFLEAHTRARIESTSIDIPTSTSERWLRHAAPADGPGDPVSLPEEEAVIAALGQRTGLGDDLDVATRRLDELLTDFDAASEALESSRDLEDEAYKTAAAELLAQWPVLDDPWHPLFARTLDANYDAIAATLETSATVRDLWGAMAAADRRAAAVEELRVQKAPVERLVRALENRLLASRLSRHGGSAWATYRRMVSCERGTLPTRR